MMMIGLVISRAFLAGWHFDLVEEHVLIDQGVVLEQSQLFEVVARLREEYMVGLLPT